MPATTTTAAGGADLDLSGTLGQRMTVKVDDYEFSLVVDVPTPLFVRLVQALSVLGGAMQGETISNEKVADADADIWSLVEAIMADAHPAPQRPVREIFTSATALQFLGFLAGKYKAAVTGTSTASSPSPGSITAPSA